MEVCGSIRVLLLMNMKEGRKEGVESVDDDVRMACRRCLSDVTAMLSEPVPG